MRVWTVSPMETTSVGTEDDLCDGKLCLLPNLTCNKL